MKNYVEDGQTISIINTGGTTITSGSPVAIGDLLAIAVTDIPAGATGTGIASGVVTLPKLAADNIPQGKSVYIKGGVVQLDATGATPAGKAWEAAAANSTTVAVRLNG